MTYRRCEFTTGWKAISQEEGKKGQCNGETGLPTLTLTTATIAGGPLSEKRYSCVSQLYFSHHHTSGPQREVERDAETLLLPETT